MTCLRQLSEQRKTKIEKPHYMPNNKVENMQMKLMPDGKEEGRQGWVG